MTEIDSGDMGSWLSPEELEFVRRKVPMLYVDIVPVRTDTLGRIEAVGMLLCADADGVLSRALVSGRVLYCETIREALHRHIDNDLGPMALPQFPPSLTPFTLGEYFPTPGEQLYDPRQHAVSLGYIVPMNGDCQPSSDALEFSWFTPGEAATESLQHEMTPGHAAILRRALAHLGLA
ncbi:MAG: DUF4916 domain-containing protein [Actinomycetaceae bacterium]|nr:NUDIX hydrolase family protein [Arcanobacterium sp.]MDD7504715.1 DUF4916 domain-containing protein [Actinomycetaceae bacterium]MDY6143110.1 DUF4916 domain-containing protein [Arcanobacterium sp.]